MAESLFRFLLLRPPAEQDSQAPSISLAQTSDFQKKLSDALKSQTPRQDSVAAAQAFIASPLFLKSPAENDFQRKVVQFSTLLDQATLDGILRPRSVVEAATKVFGGKIADLIKTDNYKKTLASLRDSVVAIKYVQGEHSRPIEGLVNQIRDLELIPKAADTTTLDAGDAPKGESVEKTEEASIQTVSPWQAQTVYKVGDKVWFNLVLFSCIQAHTSVEGWEPPRTPALWVREIESLPGSSGPGTPGTPDLAATPDVNLFQYRHRSLLLPVEADLGSTISDPVTTGEGGEGGDGDPRETEARELIERHKGLLNAVQELTSVDPEHFQALEQTAHPGVAVDDDLTALQLQTRQVGLQKDLGDLNVDQFRAAAERQTIPLTGKAEGVTVTDPLQIQDAGGAVSALGLTRELLAAPTGVTPKPKFNPQAVSALNLKLKEGTPLSEGTKSLLSAKGITPSTVALPEIVKTLRDDLTGTLSSLKLLAPTLEEVTLSRIGSTIVTTKTPIKSQVTDLIMGHNFSSLDPLLPVLPPDGRIPHSIGKAAPAGVADLLVVKQQLIGYEGADVAHIENVLKGESKSREHTSTNSTQTTTFTETEVTTTDDHELSSTSRFEMSRETSETLKEDQSLKAGVQVSAKYGPFTEISANVEGSTSRSKEEVNKSASKFSQDVTERTAKKITERTLERQSTTITSEIVEKNTHGINNVPGTGNISGVYQWVNKIYEAQVFNYGLRTMFDFMVPEPASFIIDVMTKAADKAQALVKPPTFTLTPDQINQTSYLHWVLTYQATNVVPPPQDFITKAEQINKGDGDSKTNYFHSATITIDDGYEAVYGTVMCLKNVWSKDCNNDVFLGKAAHRFVDDGQWVWNTSLGKERGSIAWGFETYRLSDVVVGVEINCTVTPRAVDAWRADTHAKLLTAYNARLQEYEDKLANLKLETGVAIQGNNPTANLNLIKQELKKNCISILTAQHFDLFNSISVSSHGLSEINLFEAEGEGPYVRFFEQAFEWDQIMYVAYPYFWGRKSKWATRLGFDDPDPVFDEFLKAGFSRVVVPARPGFEGAIDHFLSFGQLWMGESLPPISSPLFLPIADEIAERAQKPGGEIPQGETWTIKIPTSLVKLRPDNQLPRWKKNANGDWVPDE